MQKKLLWSKVTKQPVENVVEQYIPLPLAISDNEGLPRKGQKKFATTCLEARYRNSNPTVFMNSISAGWTPECCILEGMFMINTTPTGNHKTFEQYGNFLIRRFIVPQWARGATEVHVLFHNPGWLSQTPKEFERNQRDKAAHVITGHVCDDITGSQPIPRPWMENFIHCRTCKRHLVLFLTKHFLNKASMFMQQGQLLLVAGGFDGPAQDAAWTVTKGTAPTPQPSYRCIAEESDTRIWYNVKTTSCTRILIMSPDTDIYHVGLPLAATTSKDIIVQLNKYTSKELLYLHLSSFLEVLAKDPDLSSIPPDKIPQIFQSVFVTSGCDITSFFSQIGKATFYRHLFKDAEFITGGNSIGTLADTGLHNNQFKTGFLAFLRMVGTVYFRKNNTAFLDATPSSHFQLFQTGLTPLKCHENWLDDIRVKTGDRSHFENEMVPSTEALYRHWMRSCWVINMWRQADREDMVLPSVSQFGWIIDGDKLIVDWDSKENMSEVHERVQQLTRGCKCKTGCGSKRCGCRGKGKKCGVGCGCINCTNTSSTTELSTTSTTDDLLTISVEECLEEATSDIPDDVDDLMDWVFGEENAEAEVSEVALASDED